MVIELDVFRKEIGREVPESEWASAMTVYEQTSLDEAEFCDAYRSNPMKIYMDLIGQLTRAEICAKEFVGRMDKFAVGVARDAYMENLDSLRDLTREAVGVDRYSRICLENGFKLAKEDREYLMGVMDKNC